MLIRRNLKVTTLFYPRHFLMTGPYYSVGIPKGIPSSYYS
jgi:hypothetical protein